jgi:hypothetical protein
MIRLDASSTHFNRNLRCERSEVRREVLGENDSLHSLLLFPFLPQPN